MKKTFTIPALLAVLFGTITLTAQNINPVRITVNSPAIDWEIDGLQANFGGDVNLTGPYTGKLVWVTDGVTEPTDGDIWSQTGQYGCTTTANPEEIGGNIALIGRGACEFGVKLLTVDTIGAIAGIIANRAPIGVQVGSHVPGLIWMAGGSVGDLVTIPGIFMTYEDRAAINKLLESGEELTVSISAPYIYDVAAAYAYKTPQSQIVPLDDIMMVLINRDTVPLLEVTASATITSPGGDTVTLSEVIDTLMPAISFDSESGETLVNFDDSFTPSDVGEYTVTFEAHTTGGTHAIDQESVAVSFWITDDFTFALDDGTIDDPDGFPMVDNAYIDSSFIYNVGSIFRTGINGATVTDVSFALANPADLAEGMDFNLSIYDLDLDGNDTIDTAKPTTPIASATYTLTGAETPNKQLFVPFDAGVDLDADGVYLLMVEHDGFLSDNFISPAYTTAGGMSYPGYGSVYSLGNFGYNIDGFEYWNDDTPGFPHGGRHPAVRMYLEGFVNSAQESLDNTKISLAPNPVSDVVRLSLSLEKLAPQVDVNVIDFLGRLVETHQLENVKEGTYSFEVQGLAAGTYFLSVSTPEGFRAEKFVVVH